MFRPSYTRSATFTRPSDTTQYAVGDLVANSTTAGSVTLLSWANPEGGIWLRRLRLTSSNTSTTSAAFRLWLTTDSAITFANGDNGALSISGSTLSVADVLTYVDISLDAAATGLGAVGVATFDANLHALHAASYANGVGTIYGFLEARGTYTPASAEVFTLYLRGDPL